MIDDDDTTDDDAIDDDDLPDPVLVAQLVPAEARSQLLAIARETTTLTAWRGRLEKVLTALNQQLAECPALPTRVESAQFEELNEAVAQVRKGVRRGEGVSNHIPFKFAGKPGLVQTGKQLLSLAEEAKVLQKHLERWPDETTTHPFTFTGTGLAMWDDDRVLKKGDVVNLTRTQAFGWRDKFTPVVAKPSRKPAAQKEAIAS